MAEEKTSFKDIIKAFLDNKAAEDPLFAVTYAKPHKNLDDCCSYIIEEARKVKDGNTAVLTDAAVYSLAVHYYDEDDIQVKPAKKASVKVSMAPTPQSPAPTPKKPEWKQLSLFDM